VELYTSGNSRTTLYWHKKIFRLLRASLLSIPTTRRHDYVLSSMTSLHVIPHLRNTPLCQTRCRRLY